MSRPVPENHATGAGPFGYQPALDGVRALAVTLVLLFHGGFGWMGGGYVGVSVFFTLSGFLITSLLILEHQRTGAVSWSSFVVRRAKRLLPASLLCLVMISLLSAAGQFAAVPHLRRDVLGAALQVANWNALSGSDSYADLFSRSIGVRSPVDHFWSLAVEEQFYWLWPLVFVGLTLVARRRSHLVAGLAVLAVVGVVASRVIAVRWGPDAAYWATPARLGEILVGAALAGACLLWRRRPRWLGWFGWAGLATVLWAAAFWPSSGGPAYAGWFGVFSLSSAALILGVQAEGPLRRILSVAPAVWLGRISYGVYVFHWPVFLLVTARSVHVTGVALFAVRLAITFAVALLSFHLVEQPIRRSAAGPRRAMAVAVPAMGVMVLVAMIAVPTAPGWSVAAAPRPTLTTAVTSTTTTSTITTSTTTASTTTSTTVSGAAEVPTVTVGVPDPATNVMLIGDSTAVALLPGLDAWASTDEARTVTSIASLGCGLVRNSSMLGDTGNKFRKQCSEALDERLPQVLATVRPDTALIMVTMADVVMRTWSNDEGMLSPTDELYAARMLADYRSMAEALIAGGVRHIAWVVPATPSAWWEGWKAGTLFDADMWSSLNSVIESVARDHPDVVEVVRLDQWFVATGAIDDNSMRSDGVHFTPDGAVWVVNELLGPVLLRLAAV